MNKFYFIPCLKNRLDSNIESKSLNNKVAESIYTSKIGYGLQLLGKVRLTERESTQGDLREIQLVQNKLARALNFENYLTTDPQSLSLQT